MPVTIEDAFAGRTTLNPAEEAGDFVVWTKRGTPAYQLAVVVDDARQGVTRVVRGDDLLPSAGRQVLLYRALGLGPLPVYTHLPLVLGPDGRRLAKRHGDTRLTTYQQQGVPVERILGLLAHWSLPGQPRAPIDLAEFAVRLDLDTMPSGRARFTPEDDAWLLGRS
jgi:glutamyl-tRNA synthetase